MAEGNLESALSAHMDLTKRVDLIGLSPGTGEYIIRTHEVFRAVPGARELTAQEFQDWNQEIRAAAREAAKALLKVFNERRFDSGKWQMDLRQRASELRGVVDGLRYIRKSGGGGDEWRRGSLFNGFLPLWYVTERVYWWFDDGAPVDRYWLMHSAITQAILVGLAFLEPNKASDVLAKAFDDDPPPQHRKERD